MPRAPEFRLPLLRDWLFGPETGPHLSVVDLPHTAAELSWREWDPADWERRWRYRKHFDLAPTAGTRYFLRFAGALTRAEPVLNGRVLPPHTGGYLPFEHEVTGLLRERNVLDVVVDGAFDPAAPPNHGPGTPSHAVDFWQPAGLYREVELVGVPSQHVADVFARPFSVLDDPGLDVRCELDLDRTTRGLRVSADLRRDGQLVDSTSLWLPELPPGRHPVTPRMPALDGISLWHIDDPVLYDVAVTLSSGMTPIHEHRVRTGFREARFDRSGLHLNGERIQVFGLNRHQFFPFAGGAMPERVQRRDAEILRADLNCTMVRCSHYPQHESFLTACDELGLLVWDEVPGWQHLGGGQWLDHACRDVHDMIVRDRNHPSVVLWGVRLNETPGNAAHYTRVQRLAKSLDDSRQTAGAVHPADHDTLDFQQDVFGYNDYTPSGLAPPRTDFPYLVSEAIGTLTGPSRFYRRTDPQEVLQGQAIAHARVHDLAMADERCAGLLAWAGFDYPSGNGNVFQGIKWPGVVDVFRIPKPGAAMYRAQVDPRRRPVIEPSFHWDPHSPSPVTDLGARAAIWSNLDRLELHLDGHHHATLRPARAEFPSLPHPPFFADLSTVDDVVELRVDGYLDGALALTRRFSADRSRDRLALRFDDAALISGGSDATRAELRAVDEHGADRPHVSGSVALELTGPAVLIGQNPFPLGETGGAGAVWLRSTDGTGTVRLRALHPELGVAEANIEVKP
ncbi:glycoside hydrolase family 2 protein [Saccharopolyspora taberi]|uniref:Glycoside hydrolase family 2 TIM barrel-domain containing protein n=1 Tax=Saccharopolyspora taberi TaxID=60895 RepID=A0ABN3VJ06_9PSEU